MTLLLSTHFRIARALLAGLLLWPVFNAPAEDLATAISYQGQLQVGGTPANGRFDLRFTLHDDAEAGAQIGPAVPHYSVTISNGHFAVMLDFGPGAFVGRRWLEIAARASAAEAFSILRPRQQIQPTPQALVAASLSGTLSTTLLSGALPPALLEGVYAKPLTLSNPSNSFGGNGAGLTNLDGRNLRPGTVNSNMMDAATLALLTAGDGVGWTNVIVVAPATGDATRDTASLQWALDRTTNNGVTPYGGQSHVFIPAGDYRLNDTLLLRMHGLTIEGAGVERTRLYQTSATKPVFSFQGIPDLTYGGSNTLWYLTMKNFGVQKTLQPWTTSMSAAFDFRTRAAPMPQVLRSRFENLKVAGFYYGFRFEHAVGVTMLNIEAYSCNHSYWLEKVDSAIFLNCFGGDGLSASTNRFGTNYCTAWTYKPSSYAPGFNLVISGGESRRCNTVLDAQGGNVSVRNMNVELMSGGPVFKVGASVGSADFANLRVQRLGGNTNAVIKVAAGKGAQTRVYGLDRDVDLSNYPVIELAGADDFVSYEGPPVLVTNTGAARAYYLPRVRELATGHAVAGTLTAWDLSVFGALTAGNLYGDGSGLTDLDANSLSTGRVPPARLGNGRADMNTFLRGDQTWARIPWGDTSNLLTNGETNNVVLSGSSNYVSGALRVDGPLYGNGASLHNVPYASLAGAPCRWTGTMDLFPAQASRNFTVDTKSPPPEPFLFERSCFVNVTSNNNTYVANPLPVGQGWTQCVSRITFQGWTGQTNMHVAVIGWARSHTPTGTVTTATMRQVAGITEGTLTQCLLTNSFSDDSSPRWLRISFGAPGWEVTNQLRVASWDVHSIP